MYKIRRKNNSSQKNHSYKLEIGIEPNWNKIYKQIANPKDEETWKKAMAEKTASADFSGIWGRRYFFTEYYDAVSGLMSRFQRIISCDGKDKIYPVDEFADSGWVFDSDNSLDYEDLNFDDAREHQNKLTVEVGESYIRNEIFDKHIGGPRADLDYRPENYLFKFPLHEVINFLMALGTRFHGIENNTIIKWPSQIEKKFQESNIKYETHFDYEPKEFNIEEHDVDFYKKWGEPKICLYGGSRSAGSFLIGPYGTHYNIKLKIFRPGENSRFSE